MKIFLHRGTSVPLQALCAVLLFAAFPLAAIARGDLDDETRLIAFGADFTF